MTTADTPEVSLPAQWHTQDAMVFIWPDEQNTSHPLLPDIRQCYLELIQTLNQNQDIALIVQNSEQQAATTTQLTTHNISLERIQFLIAQTSQIWIRDIGPIGVLIPQGIRYLDYRLYDEEDKQTSAQDDRLCQTLFDQVPYSQAATFCSDLIFAGGSIDCNGEGSLLTTASYLLNEIRNPHISKHELESLFKSHLGIQTIHWLESKNFLGDRVDVQIDLLARFCRKDCIAYSACDSDVPHSKPLAQIKLELENLKQRDGQVYELRPLPIPAPLYNQQQQRLPASYCGFLISNKAVYVPVFDDAHDQLACEQLALEFPTHRIIPINARAILEQGGNLHRIGMPLPSRIKNQPQ